MFLELKTKLGEKHSSVNIFLPKIGMSLGLFLK